MPHRTPRDQRLRPLRERSLVVVRWLVIALAVLELSDLLSPATTWNGVVFSVLGFAAIVTVLWRLRLGLALGALPITAFLALGSASGLLPLIVLSFCVALRGTPRLILGYGVVVTALIITDLWLHPWWGRTIPVAVLLVALMTAGAVVRLLMNRSARAEKEIISLAERVAQVRDNERTLLADELARQVNGSLADNQSALALSGSGWADARQALAAVESASRAALTRLRGLVSTLRADASSEGRTAALVRTVEEVEDGLTELGYPVELELPPEETDLLLDPVLTARILGQAAQRARDQAPPGSTFRLDLTRTSLTWSHPLPDDQETDDADLTPLADMVQDAGGCLTPEVVQGRWTMTYQVPDAPVADPAHQDSPSAPEPWRLRHWSTWVPPDVVRMVPSLAALVGVVHSAAGTLEQWQVGQPWQESAVWALTWLGVLLLTWASWAAAALLLVALALGVLVVPPSAEAFASPHIACIALTAYVSFRTPRYSWLPAVGWVGYCIGWYGGWDAAAPSLGTLLINPGLGLLLGFSAHHFVTLRNYQLAQIKRLEQEHATAREDERRQLAGELHDLVAHQLSLITLRVSTLGDATDQVILEEALREVEKINASAQHDLETLTTIMRSNTEATQQGDTSWLAPRATANTLAGSIRAAGHTVSVDLHPDTDDVDPTTARTLTRILREASTNIMRYAPEASQVNITTQITPDHAIVQVTNPLASTTRTSPDSTGWGLLGLTERAQLTGGSFHAGPSGGKWVVQAKLPRHATDGSASPSPETSHPLPAF